jgi:ABC-type transport system substrate-binding protein
MFGASRQGGGHAVYRSRDGCGSVDYGVFKGRRSPPSAVLVREHLRRVGLQADILSADLSIQKQRLWAGDFEAAIQVWNTSPGWNQFLFGDSAPTGYSRASALFNKAAASSNEDTIDAAYGEIGEIFQRDLPMVFLHPFTRSSYVHRRIRGLQGPLIDTWLMMLMEDLWVETINED